MWNYLDTRNFRFFPWPHQNKITSQTYKILYNSKYPSVRSLVRLSENEISRLKKLMMIPLTNKHYSIIF